MNLLLTNLNHVLHALNFDLLCCLLFVFASTGFDVLLWRLLFIMTDCLKQLVVMKLLLLIDRDDLNGKENKAKDIKQPYYM